MSGLFDSLSAANSGLAAAQLGLGVAGQNLANLNTVGYTRRTLDLAATPAADRLSAGRGVTIMGVRALRNEFIEARLRRELQASARDTAVVAGLADVEAIVGQPGASLDADLTAFFDSFSTLASDPTSAAARDGVLMQGALLAQRFHDLSARLTGAREDADAVLRNSIEEINRLAVKVAALNEQISADSAGAETLRDERNVAVARLAELAGVQQMTRPDGAVDLSIGQGRPLVVGTNVYPVTAVSGGPLGLASIMSGDDDITAEISSGTIGGLLQVRDSLVPGYLNQLDQLAFDLAAAVNTTHHTGFDADGNAGGDFFAVLPGVAGAASALSVDAAVAQNGRLLAASGSGAAGDNETARALAALRDANLASGGTSTAHDAWSGLVYVVGSDLANAETTDATRAQVIRQLEQIRAQSSGVSLDEEAANLMRYQRAYEANARFFTTIVDTLDALMAMVR